MRGTRYEKGEIDEESVQKTMMSRIEEFASECDSKNEPYVIYVNETNGIQALPILSKLGIPARFCNIRSTHFESKATTKAMNDIPQDMLLSAALGEHILVIDYGAKKDRSRAIYQGIPYVKYVLDRVWMGIIPNKVLIQSRSNTRPIVNDSAIVFDRWYSLLGKKTKQKLRVYKEIAKDHLGEDGVNIIGISEATEHDGDKIYYASMKKDYLDSLMVDRNC